MSRSIAEPSAEPELLARRFARRILPLALLVGASVALVPPLTYRWVGAEDLAAQAGVYARQLAHSLRRLAERDPVLWHYNSAKVIQATAVFQQQGDVAAADVLDNSGRLLFTAQGVASGSATYRGPVAEALIRARDGVVGRVRVTMEASRHRAAIGRIAAASFPVGIALALLVFLLPTRIVSRQARSLRAVLGDLQSAREHLEEINQSLAHRVQQATETIRSLSLRVLDVQEHERTRLARDLHDSLGQALTALQIDVEVAQASPGEAAARLARTAASCRAALEALRRVVRDLRPLDLEHAGATEALHAYVERFEARTGIATSFRSRGDLSAYPEAVLTCLLRVMQEALTNIARHARAREVGVSVEADSEGLALTVSDDGTGFAVEAPHAGHGLVGMSERCALLGGRCEIKSMPGDGTVVHAMLPRQERG